MKVELSRGFMDELNTILKDRAPVVHSLKPAGLLLGPISTMPSKVLFVPLQEGITARLVDLLLERAGEVRDHVAHFPRVFFQFDNDTVIMDNPLCFASETSEILKELEKVLGV